MGSIPIRELAKGYDEAGRRRQVLAGLNLDIETGQRVALVGRSGSGKSTLLNLLAGIDIPDAGTIAIAGTSLGALSERDRTIFRRKNIGFVFQFFNLLPTLTVHENVLLPLDLVGISRQAQARQRADDLLTAVGLGDRRSAFPDRQEEPLEAHRRPHCKI